MKMLHTRINDAIAYLKSNVSAALAAEVNDLYTWAVLHHLNIHNQISLGKRSDHQSTNFTANSAQRQALRALLLCQYIYYSPIWKKYTGQTAMLKASDALANGLIDTSKNHWLNKSEHEIVQALRMFTFDANATANDLALAAEQGAPKAPGKLNIHSATRASTCTASTSTCYVAVMMWLFRADLVSLPWLTRYNGANTKASLTHAFGAGTLIWNGTFGISNSLPPVPRGHIVHLWKDNNDPGWNGHWVVSLGNGAAAGENNNTELNCTKNYCKTLTLDGQFLDYGGGTVAVIDPANIPNRV